MDKIVKKPNTYNPVTCEHKLQTPNVFKNYKVPSKQKLSLCLYRFIKDSFIT
jgi:hypothetical protein